MPENEVIKGKNGGWRPGAGRRPTELRQIKDACNLKMDEIVVPELEAIFHSLVRQAKGEQLIDVWRPDTPDMRERTKLRDENGEVYSRVNLDGVAEILVNQITIQVEPDGKVGMYLIDRYLGRPFQAVKVIPKENLAEMDDEQLAAIAGD